MAERRLVNRLKDIRAERGLTQAELALQAGVSRKTINTVENGVFTPSTLLALTLADVLKLRVEDIFTLEKGKRRGSGSAPFSIADAELD